MADEIKEAPEPTAPVPSSPPGLTPSNSTNATAIGGALSALVIYCLSLKGITFPAGLESAVAVICATIAGYLPNSGRR